MSRKNRKKLGTTDGARLARFPKFVENINKFYDLCDSNESEVGRRLGVSPQLVGLWRKGINTPTKGSRPHIAQVMEISEQELMHGDFQPNKRSGRTEKKAPLSRKAEALMKRLERLLSTGDEKERERLLRHFDLQLSYVEKAMRGIVEANSDKKRRV
jgi:transcriptional regulator with XRE-family HTH domain